MTKQVFILGASSDIGVETVKIFLSNNWNVIAHFNDNAKNLKILQNKNKNRIKLLKVNFKNIKKATKVMNDNKKIFKNISSFVVSSNFLHYH